MNANKVDVVIIGAGLAGLTLARQLLIKTGKTVLLLDKRKDPPGSSQKVGESLVQLSGYYLAKVLDLEEHLLTEHFLKYNLRFHWKTEGSSNRSLEDYSVSFIRLGSNIPTFQLDRNLFETHLLEINSGDPRFEFAGGALNPAVTFGEGDADHTVAWEGRSISCRWVVDTSGRGGVLKRKLSLAHENTIRHGSTWCWVDGLVNTESLTDLTNEQKRVNMDRRKTGHMPFFLATNHFCDEGMWFWVIPLHGKTSLGLVFEHAVLNPDDVSTARKMIDYVCRKWPLFDRDLKNRKVLDEGRLYDYSYDATQTISANRWAISGEAGRFSDPLYSPGSDLITIYNTLIVDAVQTDDSERLKMMEPYYEQVMRVMYESYVPSYAVSYNCLGDQEAFTLKYAWELAVYFGFFVVPGINDMFANKRAMSVHLRKYGLLGPMNKAIQHLVSDFARWKKAEGIVSSERMIHDFYRMCPLRESEKLFYQVDLTQEEIENVFDMQFARLKEFARYIVAHVYASVLGDKRVLTNAPFIASLKIRTMTFDAGRMRADYARFADSPELHQWTLDPFALEAAIMTDRPVAMEMSV